MTDEALPCFYFGHLLNACPRVVKRAFLTSNSSLVWDFWQVVEMALHTLAMNGIRFSAEETLRRTGHVSKGLAGSQLLSVLSSDVFTGWRPLR